MEQGTPAVESPGATPVEAVLDLELLAELAGIGGEAFIARVVRDFIREVERSIADLRATFEVADFGGFRMHAHEVCSGAANLGAKALHELCSPWQNMSDAELVHAGSSLIQSLDAEWPRTRAALLERAARCSSAAPDPGTEGTHGPVRRVPTPL